MDFDPARHKIVAVVTEEGAERGQHFHLGLPDLVREIHETKVIEADGTALAVLSERVDALAARPVQTEVMVPQVNHDIPQEILERLQFVSRGFDVLRARVEAMEGQDSVSATDANELVKSFGTRLDLTIEDKLADALGDLRSRLATIEQRETPQVAKQLNSLAKAVHAVSELVESVDQTLEQKSGDLEAKYAAIARHIEGVETRVGKLANFSDMLASEVRKMAL